MAIVLIVDDDEMSLELAVTCMEIAGHSVLTASNGANALQMAQRYRPDAVLLDMVLPDAGGLEVVDSLKALDATKSIKIVMVSAEARKSFMDSAFAKGCDAYVVKPFHIDKLIASVEDVL